MAEDPAGSDLRDTCSGLADALLNAFAELLELVGLETRIAVRSLLGALVLLAVGAFLLGVAGLLLEGALIAGLLSTGLPIWGALAAAAVINAAGCLVVGKWRRALLKGIQFRGTRRQLARLRTPAYGDAAAPP
jgi:hypothetical protein